MQQGQPESFLGGRYAHISLHQRAAEVRCIWPGLEPGALGIAKGSVLAGSLACRAGAVVVVQEAHCDEARN